MREPKENDIAEELSKESINSRTDLMELDNNDGSNFQLQFDQIPTDEELFEALMT